MKYTVGIDLGSTTTKAVILGEDAQVLGRGITNSRSNYDVACQVALGEALINARFSLIAAELERAGASADARGRQLARLDRRFRAQQYLCQLRLLSQRLVDLASRALPVIGSAGAACGPSSGLLDGVTRIVRLMKSEVDALYEEGARRKSDFFRDLGGSRYVALAEDEARRSGMGFELLVGLFDKAILDVENSSEAAGRFADHARAALVPASRNGEGVGDSDGDGVGDSHADGDGDSHGDGDGDSHGDDEVDPALAKAVERIALLEMENAGSVGTGYGRQRLPFPEGQIRSEILCHGLGAHAMFPGTRTALDIGGQDTKAIQLDDQGVVTSFQMNDRCAAGCGRYLGYIADEMSLGLHELGPLACTSTRPVRINSTCTVFAGAELRERLSLGEKREDILAGLHRAIVLRAMSLLARSGGVRNEFTFTGGVAKNPAAVAALRALLVENYGNVTVNISEGSIYTGALGAALFAHREAARARAAA